MTLEGFEMSGGQATIRVQNNRWGMEAQAAGRAARVMATTLPPQIEHLRVVLQENGVPISQITTRRSDLEDLQYDYDGTWRTYARAVIDDAADVARRGNCRVHFLSSTTVSHLMCRFRSLTLMNPCVRKPVCSSM